MVDQQLQNKAIIKSGLIAFDFDETVMDTCCDFVAINMIGGQIPPEAKAFHAQGNWTDHMGVIFRHAYEAGKRKPDYDG